jgi:elongation factor P hydroxylase
MYREKSSARYEHMIATSSSCSDDDYNMSLDASQEEPPKAHASTHDAIFFSAVP